MCACLPQHPYLFIFSSRGHDRQSSDQNFSSRGYDRQSLEQNNRKLISLHNNGEDDKRAHGFADFSERVQILCYAHIICITVLENRIICCQIFCDLLLKSAFERIFNVMQLILVKSDILSENITADNSVFQHSNANDMRVTQDLNSFGEIIAHAQCSVDECYAVDFS
jgi:hypothetical protein